MIDTEERILMLLGDIKESIGGLKADARNAETSRDEMKAMLADHVKVDLAVASRVSSPAGSGTMAARLPQQRIPPTYRRALQRGISSGRSMNSAGSPT